MGQGTLHDGGIIRFGKDGCLNGCCLGIGKLLAGGSSRRWDINTEESYDANLDFGSL